MNEQNEPLEGQTTVDELIDAGDMELMDVDETAMPAVRKICVIVKEPGKAAEIRWIENTLDKLQEIVGGYIETVTLATDLTVICNEEGRLLGLAHNCRIQGYDFVGPIIFAGVEGEEFADVPEGAVRPIEQLGLEVMGHG